MDKSMLGDLDSLPEEDKIRMSAMIDQLQIRDRSPPLPSSSPLFPWISVLFHCCFESIDEIYEACE